MQPANLDLTLHRGDACRVTFRFTDGDAVPVGIPSDELSLVLTWRGGSLTVDDLVADEEEGTALWSVTEDQSEALPLGRLTSWELIRTSAADGRRTYLVGKITATDGEAPGDTDVNVAISDLTIAVTVSAPATGVAGEGVPAGGTTGQILAKATGDDYDTEWVDAPEGTGGGSTAWDDITGKPSTFAPSAHTHAISEVTGLQIALDGKADDGDLTTEATARAAADTALDERLDPVEAKLAGITSGATANAADADLRDRTTHTGVQAISTVTGLQTALDGKQTVSAVLNFLATASAGTAAAVKTLLALVKGDVGLGNVDNTSDSAKPVSTAQQAALDLKANLAGPTFTGTVSGITKSMVGLSNVDNTSDANKPVSTATQTALDLKANILDTLNTQTGTTYTVQASDNGKVVELNNASAVTVTVPNSLAVGFNCILSQIGAGLVTVVAGSGATVNAYGGLKSPGQWGELSLRVRANSGGSAAAAVLGGGVA